MSPIKPPTAVLPILLLIAAASSCDLPAPSITPPPVPLTGEVQLIVTSVSGTGIDPAQVRVELHARELAFPHRSWVGSALGILTPVTVRVFPGSYTVEAHLRPGTRNCLGYLHNCAPSASSDTVNVDPRPGPSL